MKLEPGDIVEHKGQLYAMLTWTGDAEAKRGTRVFCADLKHGTWKLAPVAGLRLRCAAQDPLLGTSRLPVRADPGRAERGSNGVTGRSKGLRQGVAQKAQPARGRWRAALALAAWQDDPPSRPASREEELWQRASEAERQRMERNPVFMRKLKEAQRAKSR